MAASSERLVRSYIAGLALVAFYVTTANGRTRIRSGTDPGVTLKSLHKADPDAGLVMIGWCTVAHAELLMMALHGEIDIGTSGAAGAIARVAAAAKQLGLVLRSESELRASAEKAVQHVDRVFREKLRAGELRDLNRRYRDERLARAAAGKPWLSYGLWLNNQKVALVRATAHVARS